MSGRDSSDSARPSGARTATAVVGGLGSVLLHALLVAPIYLGSPLHKHHAVDHQGAAAGRALPSESAMEVVFIEDNSVSAPSEPDVLDRAYASTPVSAARHNRRVTARNVRAGGQTAASDDREDLQTAATEAAGDSSGHALMFGRYMGQITARIQRAWLRPRVTLGADVFMCRVQIVQDRSGFVREVTLQRCNENIRWQISLVNAIQQASPLPAPPDPAVFSNLLTLEFDSEVLQPGGNPEGFEPELPSGPIALARKAAATRLQDEIEELRANRKTDSEAIQLTIVGVPSGNDTLESVVHSPDAPPTSE